MLRSDIHFNTPSNLFIIVRRLSLSCALSFASWVWKWSRPSFFVYSRLSRQNSFTMPSDSHRLIAWHAIKVIFPPSVNVPLATCAKKKPCQSFSLFNKERAGLSHWTRLLCLVIVSWHDKPDVHYTSADSWLLTVQKTCFWYKTQL